MEKIPNESGKTKSLTTKKVVTVLVVFLGIILVVLYSVYVNSKEMKVQMEQNLEDVARQNAVIVEAKIEAQYELLQSLAKELDGVTEETIGQKLDHFKIFMEEFHLKRFAYCFPDGMTYSTGGEIADLSYREFYQSGMDGKCYITGILTDALNSKRGSEQVNVMTIPVRSDSNEVTGVFGLAYDSNNFNDSLQVESFEGEGYSCIVNESGEILASIGNKGLEMSENLIEDVLKKNAANKASIEKIEKQLKDKTSGSGLLYLDEKCYYYSIPVDLMDGSVTWYVYTLVPAKLIGERVEPLLNNQYRTSFFVVVLVAIGASLLMAYVRQQHNEMLDYAYRDELTHGSNYAKFCLDMEAEADRQGYLVAMDIANFNNISVAAGKEAGNTMLRETWKIIDMALEKGEYAAHVRDDLFVLFLREEEEDKLLERMSEISDKISKIADSFLVYGIQARYGIYRMSGTETIEKAYSKVKLAREYAVENFGVNHAFYNEENRVKRQHEKQLEARFPTALEQQEFEVWYQPKYSAEGCEIVGSEALVRWRGEDGAMISPGEFITLFERNGMIVALDEYMFRMVCKQQRKWQDEGKKIYPVSINISRASLYCLDVHKQYSRIMQEYAIQPECIQLEVTETVMETRTDICELLNKFRHMGVKILMDDFGTGYSSLATLNSQCFDTLKLDKTLIDHIGDKDGETMLYHIIRMGQQMGLHITAEGVEKQMQLQFLQNMKCDDIQGFYFSKPVRVEEYENLIYA